MRRGTIFLLLFVVIAAVVVGISQFLQSQPPVEITVAVDPLAEAWMRDAVQAFNDSDVLINNTRRVQVQMIVISDLEVWNTTNREDRWTASDHPDAWLPAAAFSVDYARASGLPFEVAHGSTARTPLVWGGYTSRIDVLTEGNPTTLDWDAVIDAAEVQSWDALGGDEGWRFFKLAFPLPNRSIGGLAVLFSAAAAQADNAALDASAVRADGFYNWLQAVIANVPNFNTIGTDIAAFVARGPATADIGIGPESTWLTNLDGLQRNEEVYFSYPTYDFVFDFPLAVWNDVETSDEARSAVDAFGSWLLRREQQTQLTAYGLRPASGAPDESAPLFAAATPYGIELDPALTEIIEVPDLNATQGLLAWFQRNR
jgi:hypothetical protein